jgi:hypothetical protein
MDERRRELWIFADYHARPHDGACYQYQDTSVFADQGHRPVGVATRAQDCRCDGEPRTVPTTDGPAVTTP